MPLLRLAESAGESFGVNALLQEIAAMIAAEGPISLELYMKLALTHPEHGYYRRKMPIGAEGDFITAPEVHQMFGELLGLWAAEVWHRLGEPAHVSLIELGPGRGTLMADALRAASIVPRFARSLDVHLVETSEVLAASQREALSGYAVPLTWHEGLEDMPKGPVIIIANEFFDALPVRHYVRDARGWCERLIGLAPGGQLIYGLAAEPEPALKMQADPGTLLEAGVVAQEMMARIARHLTVEPGVLLAIDYGPATFQFGSTLQAVRHHRFADPLRDPGEADLTAHVDFAGLARAAQKAGALTFGPLPQGLFLTRLGIFERAKILREKAGAKQQRDIEQALDRLARPGPQTGPRASMAELFKVLAVASPHLAMLPGFEEDIA